MCLLNLLDNLRLNSQQKKATKGKATSRAPSALDSVAAMNPPNKPNVRILHKIL